MKKFIFCVTFLILQYSFVFAQQNKLDSLYKVLKKEKEDTNKVITLNAIGRIVYLTSNYPKADSAAHEALQLAQKLNFTRGIGTACRSIGNIYDDQGNYPEGLKYQLQSLQVEETAGNKQGIGSAHINIGLIYEAMGNYADALKHQLEGLEIEKELDNKLGISTSYINIGLTYEAQHKNDDALKNYQEGLKIGIETDNKNTMGYAYGNIGSVYENEGNYPEALKNQFQSLKIGRELGDMQIVSDAYLNIGSISTKQKEYATAKKYLDSAITMAKQIGAKDEVRDSYNFFRDLDSATGNFNAAFQDYKNYILYRDSLSNEDNVKKIVSEQMTYEFDKKQAIEKEEEDKRTAVSASENKRQRIVIALVGVVALAVAFIAIVVFRSLRITRKQKVVIEQQKIVVEEKNKDITDSIHYASRIQKALLTTDDYIGKYVKEYFILFKPRDIVSGDFYWAFNSGSSNGLFYLACCDCTGHGVPGAFMSLLNISMLNETVIERKITKPDLILNDIRHHIIKALNPDGSDKGKDGMDCSLCAFDFKNNTLQTSCANNPVWIVKQDKSFIEIAPDKMPVGIQYGNEKPFTMNTIQLDKGDCVYLFTDGYADQFGGPKGKKFKYKQLSEKLMAISEKPMHEQKSMLEETIEGWKGNLEQVDDILVIGIRV